MSVKRDTLRDFLNTYFGAALIEKARTADEHMPNGLQWQGKEEIKKLVLGVSANEEFFKKAAAEGADALLVHHGLNIDIAFNLFSPSLQKRLKILMENNISLFGYHYILDAHPKIGHNAQIIKKLGAKKTGIALYQNWGWVGEFSQSQSVESIINHCQKLFEHEIFSVKARQDKIRRIGVVSGRGVPFSREKLELLEKGVELYVTGEISEWNLHEFKEMGITCLACGHYNSEKFGVLALGKVIKNKFSELEVEFIDIPNPL